MIEIVPCTSKHLDEMIQEQERLVSTCGPKLYRITRKGGIAFIYHDNTLVLVIFPESVLTENNIVLANEIDDFLIEFSKEHDLEFAMARWQEYNKQPADVFLDWMAENHPEYKFEAEYIGPEMKDTRTKFGVHYENGQKVYYN